MKEAARAYNIMKNPLSSIDLKKEGKETVLEEAKKRGATEGKLSYRRFVQGHTTCQSWVKAGSKQRRNTLASFFCHPQIAHDCYWPNPAGNQRAVPRGQRPRTENKAEKAENRYAEA